MSRTRSAAERPTTLCGEVDPDDARVIEQYVDHRVQSPLTVASGTDIR